MRALLTPKNLFLAALLAAAASVPVTASAVQSLIFYTFLYVSLSVAWNIIGGYGGQTSFGHAAFFGLGAYTSAILALGNLAGLRLPPLLTIPLAGVVAGVFALLIGFPTLRLRGPYFSIATIGVGEATRLLMLNSAGLTGGASGLNLPVPADIKTYALQYFYVGLAWMVIVLAGSWWIRRSRFGLGLFAINMDTDAAETLGVDTARSKVLALMVSAFLVGVCGSIYAQQILYVDPNEVFGFKTSIAMVLMATIGGIGTLWGPVLGAIIYFPVNDRLSTMTLTLLGQELALTRFNLLLFGLLLVAIILGEPRGLMGIGERLWKRVAPRARVNP
jgi:branched-chain amino acid transport system permease protein